MSWGIKTKKQTTNTSTVEGYEMSITQIHTEQQSQNGLRPQPRMELVTVTPELAKNWLGNNGRNRRMKARAVQRMAEEMTNGLWRSNTPSTIAIGWDGVLLDGQHRLAAVAESGVSIQTWVMFDADPSLFEVIDTGGCGTRTTGQVLDLAGIPNANSTASITGMYLRMQRHPDVSWNGFTSIPHAEIREFVKSHSETLVVAVDDGTAARRVGLHRNAYGAVALAVRLSSVAGLDQWEEFCHQVMTGEMLSEGSPALSLRRWAINRRGMNVGSASQQIAVAAISKAWNAHVEGRRIKQIKWSTRELPMPLPAPSGW